MEYLLTGFLLIILTGCGDAGLKSSSAEQPPRQVQIDTVETEPQQIQTVTVKGNIYGLKSRCGGGANIPENHNIQINGIPLSDQLFYFRKGAKNDTLLDYFAFKTDSTGAFNVELEPGTYCLIRREHLNAPKFVPSNYRMGRQYVIDETCYAKWWESGLHTIQVTDTTEHLKKIVLEFPCEVEIPCLCIRNYAAMTRP